MDRIETSRSMKRRREQLEKVGTGSKSVERLGWGGHARARDHTPLGSGRNHLGVGIRADDEGAAGLTDPFDLVGAGNRPGTDHRPSLQRVSQNLDATKPECFVVERHFDDGEPGVDERSTNGSSLLDRQVPEDRNKWKRVESSIEVHCKPFPMAMARR